MIESALSGATAFDKARAHPPDILIVMMLMPDVPGVEIGLRISQESSCGVLFVTATADIEQEYFRASMKRLSSTRMPVPGATAAFLKLGYAYEATIAGLACQFKNHLIGSSPRR